MLLAVESIRYGDGSSMGGKQSPMPSTATTKAKLEGQVPPAAWANEAPKEFAVTVASIFGTSMILHDMPHTLVDRAGQPALLMLELSARLCLLFYLWVVFITRVLTIDGNGARRLSFRVLLCVLAWIISAVAVSGCLADTATGIVTAMLVMYVMSLGVAGLFAWCLGEYLRTRNSTLTTSTWTSREPETTSAPDVEDEIRKSKDELFHKKSTAKEKLGQEHHVQDLEAGLLTSSEA